MSVGGIALPLSECFRKREEIILPARSVFSMKVKVPREYIPTQRPGGSSNELVFECTVQYYTISNNFGLLCRTLIFHLGIVIFIGGLCWFGCPYLVYDSNHKGG